MKNYKDSSFNYLILKKKNKKKTIWVIHYPTQLNLEINWFIQTDQILSRVFHLTKTGVPFMIRVLGLTKSNLNRSTYTPS